MAPRCAEAAYHARGGNGQNECHRERASRDRPRAPDVRRTWRTLRRSRRKALSRGQGAAHLRRRNRGAEAHHSARTLEGRAVMATFETVRVLHFGDCDPAGIAYFPRYFDLLNSVVEDWWAAMGLPWRILFGRRRIGLPTVRFEVDFHAPAYLEDELRFSLAIKRIGKKSIELDHLVWRDDTILWECAQILVATSLDTHKSIAWPEDLRTALTTFQEAPNAHHPAA